ARDELDALKPADGLAHRPSTYPELGGERRFVDDRAGRQVTIENEVQDLLEDLVATGVAARRRCVGLIRDQLILYSRCLRHGARYPLFAGRPGRILADAGGRYNKAPLTPPGNARRSLPRRP